MSTNEVIINKKDHPDIYEWLSKNVKEYRYKQNYYALTSEGKINAYCYVNIDYDITQIKYPFDYVSGGFQCVGCRNLTSLIGTPKRVDGGFYFSGCYEITSLIGAPKEVGGDFKFGSCYRLISLIGFPKIIKGKIIFPYSTFSNDMSDKKEYKLYLAMWLEHFEGISNDERLEYITNYKDKKAGGEPIIPIEIMKEYGF